MCNDPGVCKLCWVEVKLYFGFHLLNEKLRISSVLSHCDIRSFWEHVVLVNTLGTWLGLFQKLSSGGGAHFLSDPSTPRTHNESQLPDPQDTVSALINPPHYRWNMPWPPGQVTSPPPTPWTHCQQNTLPPPDKKVFAAHAPLRIISGTALNLCKWGNEQ